MLALAFLCGFANSQAGIVTTLAGGSSSGFLDGLGTTARFSFPAGGDTSSKGGMLVTDANGAVRGITASGFVTTVATGLTLGVYGVSDLGLEPSGTSAFIAGGPLTPTVSRVNISTGAVGLVAGGVSGYADGQGSAARFNFPNAVECDAAGNAYIGDSSNNLVRVIAAGTSIVTTLAGGGCAGCIIAGFSNGVGSAALFRFPAGLAASGGTLYVADVYNNRVRAIVIATKAVSSLAGAAAAGWADGSGTAALFYYPLDVAIDGSGNLVIADYYNNAVRRVTIAGDVTTVAGAQLAGYTNGVGTAARFNSPSTVMVNASSGVIYVADAGNNVVRAIAIAASPTASVAPTVTPSPTHAVVLTSTVCGTAQQGYAASAACPTGLFVTAVAFASYGLPSISCISSCSFTTTACNAPSSQTVVAAACVGKTACSVLATDTTFGSVPCAGTKNLAFALTCAAALPPMSPSTTASASAAVTSSNTASRSRSGTTSPPSTPSVTVTNTATVTASPTSTATGTASPSATVSKSAARSQTPSATASQAPVWQTLAGVNCVGGDRNVACGLAGAPDAQSLTLASCKALCIADPACAGIVSLFTGGCYKKCSTGWTPLQQSLSTCSFLPARMGGAPMPALPTPSATPSPLPTAGLTAGHFFTATGAYQSYTVPTGVSAVDVELWGAGGGTLQPPAFGGAGAYVLGRLAVTPGESLRIIVGVAGSGRGGAASVADASGGGGAGFLGSATAGAGGGGRSAVQKYIGAVWTDVVVAGGGGGGCYSYTSIQPLGGAASWNGTGARGTDEVATVVAGGGGGGGGGNLTSGGRAAQVGAAAGAARKGGDACASCAGFGSGGGGGYFGGGSGGCGGGGGGSSFISNLLPPMTGASASPLLPHKAGGTSSKYYQSLLAPGDADHDGLVVIKAQPPCDAAGRCYMGLLPPSGTGFSQPDARSACLALGAGWDLPAVLDAQSSADVLAGSCRGTVPPSVPFWTGLQDSPPYARRFRITNRTHQQWRWSSGAPPTYFFSLQTTQFWSNYVAFEPNNYDGEYCVHTYPRHGYTVNDLYCTNTNNWEDGAPFGACCQLLPPATTVTASVSNSATRSTSPSMSTSVTSTRSASRTGSASSSATVSGSASQSPTRSLSDSLSKSPSMSVTVSASTSTSVSGTRSVSRSPTDSLSATPSPSRSASASGSLSVSVSASGSATVTGSSSVSGTATGTATLSGSATGSATPSLTPSISGTPAPVQNRCGNGTSVQTVTLSGTLLVTTPAAPAVNLACSWIIQAPAGSVITLSVLAFNAQPQIDWLSVFDGPSASSPPLYYQITGGATPPSVTSSSNAMYVWFLSTNYASSKGVVATPVFSAAGALAPLAGSNGALLNKPAGVANSLGGALSADGVGAGSGGDFRCGPGTTSGSVNASGSVIITDPALPSGGTQGPTVDCTVTVTAPPGMVAVLTYVQYSLLAGVDFLSIFDGSSAAAPPLAYMATGAFAGAANSTVLPPVLVSSTPFFLIRFQSVDFLPAVGRGVVVAVTFVTAPRSAVPVAAPAPGGSGSTADGALPLACSTVDMAMRPWQPSANPDYPLGGGAVCSLPPAVIGVSALPAGTLVKLGWQAPGSTALLRDGVTYSVVLQNCASNCSVADVAVAAVGAAPDRFRERTGCGFSGTCPFLWSWTDSSGALLAPPALAMTTPMAVPVGAAYLSFGYSQTNYCAASGAASVCIFVAPPSPTPQSVSATLTASPSASSLPASASLVVSVTVVISGPDASACAASTACLSALLQAVTGFINAVIVAVELVGAGTGSPPTSAAHRALAIAADTSRLLQDAAAAPGAFPGSGAAVDALSAALFTAVTSDPAAPLWASLKFALASNVTGGLGSRRNLQDAGAAALASVNEAASSGALATAFAVQLTSALAADPMGIGAVPGLVAYAAAVGTGAATVSAASSVPVSDGGAASPTASQTVAGPGSAGGASSDSSAALSAGAIAGIAVAGAALLIFVGLVALRQSRLLRGATRTMRRVPPGIDDPNFGSNNPMSGRSRSNAPSKRQPMAIIGSPAVLTPPTVQVSAAASQLRSDSQKTSRGAYQPSMAASRQY